MALRVRDMKKIIMKKCMNFISKNDDSLTDEQLEIIEYGLVGLYLTITKLIVIIALSLFLGIWKEVIIFLLLYNIIRMTSFGLHATKSWICLVCSTLVFIGVPFLCKEFVMKWITKLIIGVICTVLMFKNAPADTYKRPIVSKKRRMVYKVLSTLTSFIMVAVALIVKNSFLSNALIMVLVVQNNMISPTIYRLFHLPYDNYKNYQMENC